MDNLTVFFSLQNVMGGLLIRVFTLAKALFHITVSAGFLSPTHKFDSTTSEKHTMSKWSGKNVDGQPIKASTIVQPVTTADKLDGYWLTSASKQQRPYITSC